MTFNCSLFEHTEVTLQCTAPGVLSSIGIHVTSLLSPLHHLALVSRGIGQDLVFWLSMCL